MELLASSLLLFLSFFGSSAEQNILPPGPVDVIMGKNVTLNILIERTPSDIVIWSFASTKGLVNIATLRPDKVILNDAYKGRASVNQTNGHLTVSALKVEDSGDYSVQIIGDGGAVGAEINVRVLVPVSDVLITPDVLEAVEYNSTVVLTCSAKGSFLKFSWTNNTTPIVADGKRLTLTEAADSSKLTIRDVLRSDLVGPIFCMAKNSLEEGKSPAFNLTVYYGPDQVAIDPPKPNRYIESNAAFNLTCSASSKPPATFTWFFNQDEIKANGPILTLKTIEQLGFGKHLGDYTCRAGNAKTKRVIASPAVSFSVMESISGAKITGPSGNLMAGNSSANLSCQATSGNVTQIIWLKNGQDLPASSSVVFSNDKSSVFISMLQKEDNGDYTCRLVNSVSQKEDTFKLVVIYGPEPVKLEGKAEVALDQRVVLTCSSSSVPPANFTWKLNSTALPVKTNQFIIEKAIYKDSGMYTCDAYNAITGKTTTSTHTLTVKEEIYEGLSDGAIAGIVIACLVAVGASIALFFYCRQKVPISSPY